MALDCELNDPTLQGLWVLDVLPIAGGSSLLVEVSIPDERTVTEVMQHLDRAKSWLRAEIAHTIHRKRTPHLQFVVLPQGALPQEEDDDGR